MPTKALLEEMKEQRQHTGIILEDHEWTQADLAVYNLPIDETRDSGCFIESGHYLLPQACDEPLKLNAKQTDVLIDGLVYGIAGQQKLYDELDVRRAGRTGRWQFARTLSQRARHEWHNMQVEAQQDRVHTRIQELSRFLGDVVIAYEQSKQDCTAYDDITAVVE